MLWKINPYVYKALQLYRAWFWYLSEHQEEKKPPIFIYIYSSCRQRPDQSLASRPFLIWNQPAVLLILYHYVKAVVLILSHNIFWLPVSISI